MRALVVDAFGAAPEIRDVPEPVCPDDGVIIEVGASGLCRSDWHGWAGHDPDIALPHVPGHEFAGVVVAAGTAVRRHLVGARVTVPFVCACGVCATCRDGAPQVCPNQFQPGFTGWGSFAERVAIPHADANVVLLPDELDVAAAAGLGCRFATAYRAVRAHGRVRAGDWVAVFGCGGVGLAATMIAAASGARVAAIDVAPAARELAASVGAEAVFDAADAHLVEQVRERSGGGAHASIDALGGAATCLASIGVLRRRGRHVQVGLLVGDDATVELPMARVIAEELEIYGSHGMAAADYPQLLAEIGAGRLRPQAVVTTSLTLDDLAGRDGALARMDTHPFAGAAVVTMSDLAGR